MVILALLVAVSALAALAAALGSVSPPAPPTATVPAVPPTPPADEYDVGVTLSSASPAPDTPVTVYVTLTSAGQGVAGATMIATWHDGTATATCAGGPSGADGVMSCQHDIGTTAPGYEIAIDVAVSYQGQTFRTSISFTPH